MVRKGGLRALLALVGVSYWVVTLVVLTLVNGDGYDSLTQPGSELALGPFGWAMDLAFFVLGAGSGTRPSVHNAFGLAAFLLTMAAMSAAARAFRADDRWQRMATPTLVWTIVAFGTFLLVPLMGETRLGLAQRIFVAVVFSWYLLAAKSMYRVSRHRFPVDSLQDEHR